MAKNGRAVFISLLLLSPQIIMKVYMLKCILILAALAFQPIICTYGNTFEADKDDEDY